MSFSTLEAGHGGTSAGAADYPLRTLVHDRLRRDVQRALDALLPDHGEGHSDPPDRSDEEFAEWLRSDDSPLLLENVEEFVRDPEAHLRALAERVEGPGLSASQLPGEELVVDTRQQQGDDNKRDPAEELRARLRTLAKLDAERILAVPRRRGTPKGETRTHYLLLVSPDRDISNSVFKKLVLDIVRRRWPGAVVVGYVHRDTNNTHLHLWLSAATLSGKKISVKRETPSGDAVLDKYPDLDEEVARSVSRHFNDPAIYDDHMARKLEWVHWRERFEEALRRGERPPVMPHRARHDYDWLGERRAVSDRERDENRPSSGAREKAAPVPRAKSLMGALELWGKSVHLEARVNYRRALLDSLDAWRDQIDYPVEDMKNHLEQKLGEAVREHERYKDAFGKTLENRARKEYPALKYPLHNSKQIAEMEEIARLTRDPELLRYVRSYTELDRPSELAGETRDVGSRRWRDRIEARLEVLERAEMLVRVTAQQQQLHGATRATARAVGVATATAFAGRPSFDRDGEIIKGWLGGGWPDEQMWHSLPCIETEAVRQHAARYLEAREFFAAAGERLAARREEDGRLASPRLSLAELDLARIGRLVGGDSSSSPVTGERERTLLLDLVASARSEREASPRETARLLEADIRTDAGRRGDYEVGRTRGVRIEREEFRPHDDEWAGRLAALLTLRETEALALAMSDVPRARFEAVREDVYARRDLMELTRRVRAASGMSPDAARAGVLDDGAAGRALDRHLQTITEGLRSHGNGWKEWQAAGVAEFKLILSEREREIAGHVVEEVRARLAAERRAAVLERLEPQFDSAAQAYVLAAYSDEGLEVMREPGRLNEHVRVLAERFAGVARAAGYEPESLGLMGRDSEARAERVLSDSVERLGREERDALELGRLEARMILARAVRSEAATAWHRFADHAPFHTWSYETLDGRGSASLCETRLAPYEETDEAALRVAENAGEHILRSRDKVQGWLTEVEAPLAVAAEAATRAYETRERELAGNRLRLRLPVFEPGELARLEEAAVATRDHELIELIARCEDDRFGPMYAAQRAMGRALRAVAVSNVEYAVPERYEQPIAAARLERLPEEDRAVVSGWLGRHREARVAERAAAHSFREHLDAQANLRVAEVSRMQEQQGQRRPEVWGSVRPLLTEVEAGEIYRVVMTTDDHGRRSWEQMTKYAVVAVGADKLRKGDPPGLYEWARHNSVPQLGSEYGRGISGMVLSHSEARERIRQENKELGREHTTETRSSPGR